MEKLLVTQALDERDLLRKKIADKISKATFVDVVKNNEDTGIYSKLSREEFKKKAEADYQQIQDMISRYERICVAIVDSNANTTIKTSYGDYTIAGAIALRDKLRANGSTVSADDLLMRYMENKYNDYVRDADQKNRSLAASAENMRLSILGKDSKGKQDDKPLEVVNAYVWENTVVLLDPLDIKAKVEAIRDRHDTLLRELDTQIKVSNATTYIEF